MGRGGLVRFPRLSLLRYQKGEASQFLPQMIGLIVGDGRLPAQLKSVLVNNGRFFTTYQAIIPQKEALVRENVELEQIVVCGGNAVGVEGLRQDGR